MACLLGVWCVFGVQSTDGIGKLERLDGQLTRPASVQMKGITTRGTEKIPGKIKNTSYVNCQAFTIRFCASAFFLFILFFW